MVVMYRKIRSCLSGWEGEQGVLRRVGLGYRLNIAVATAKKLKDLRKKTRCNTYAALQGAVSYSADQLDFAS